MIRQLSIFAENKKGAMNRMTQILADAGINMNTLITNDSAEFGIIRMLVSDTDRAAHLAVPIQVGLVLAGSIESIVITVNVTV